MSVQQKTIHDIRETIKQNLNQAVFIEAHRSKKKLYSKRGRIIEAYSNIFIIELEEGAGSESRLSFSYTDLLTDNVKLFIVDENDQQRKAIN